MIIKKAHIILLLLFATIVVPTIAQNSAQAVMRVSVKVVEGSSVEAISPNFIILASNVAVDLGSVLLRGNSSENSVIKMSSVLTLSNGEGNNIQLDVNSTVEEDNYETTTKLGFSGFVPADIKADSYKGQLSTTIEYY